MGRFFGTDGIRGRAGQPPLDDATVQKIGRAIVRALGVRSPRVLLGRDTRESGARLEAHLAAGLAAEGAVPESAGVLPTPAIAHLARQGARGREGGYDLGVVLSASHNPYEDNGIKVFGGAGRKFSPELADAVVRQGAEMGMAFDGDGDRCILADAAGRVVDGDHVLFLAARDLKARDALKGGAVVATIMSNVGLEVALGQLGIPLVRTAVGDRNVLEEMERRGANLGGEQSGHVIFRDHEPTGDGLLTALKVLEVVAAAGRSLAELAAELPVYPQVLRNARVRDKADIESIPEIRAALDDARSRLDGRGRLVVRYSGTEPVLRVMAEGPDETEVSRLVDVIIERVSQRLG